MQRVEAENLKTVFGKLRDLNEVVPLVRAEDNVFLSYDRLDWRQFIRGHLLLKESDISDAGFLKAFGDIGARGVLDLYGEASRLRIPRTLGERAKTREMLDEWCKSAKGIYLMERNLFSLSQLQLDQ